MDVRHSPEQVALGDSVRRVVERLGPASVGQLDDGERAAKLDAAVGDAGWRELRNPVDATGAPWASAVEVAIVAEALARGRADAAFLGPVLAADLRRLAGVPDALGPETVALAAGLAALAVVGDDAVALDAFGEGSALLLVPAPDGWSLGAVPVAGRGDGVDLTRPTAPVPVGAARGVEGAGVLGPTELDRWTALALAVTAADLVGTMAGAVALAVDHAAQRHQFSRAIGSFQAVQHLLADAVVHTEGSRSAALHAAWAVDALPPAEALAAAARAKAYAARAARTVCETAIQVHGGIGNTWDCLAHVHLRRALLSTDILGGVGPNLARVLAHAGVGGG
ncbi:MAG: acyl-CoA dehydrogenase family protein [Acidimicrobiia bacterium]